MPNMSTQTQARPLFAAKLTPHRSLGHRGARVVIAVMAIAATIPGIVFYSLGAWPIVGFLGLDVLLVWWALSANMKDGKRFEEVTLWNDQLELRQVDGQWPRIAGAFPPARREVRRGPRHHERTTGLHLRTRDADFELGAFLELDDKSSFAKAFGTALKRARLG